MAVSATNGVPVLWHLKVSSYNEKARWALDYKRVWHFRRALVPGSHRKRARRLSGGETLPVLVLDGRAFGDSTEILAELERRYPEPSLYPADREERRRALALEDFFDEHVGPHVRLLAVHHMHAEPDVTLGAFFPDLRGARYAAARAGFPLIRRRMRRALGIQYESVERAFHNLEAAGARFLEELQPSGYLAGDQFSVADLTLAAMLAPAVAPPEFPYPQPQREHPAFAPLREVLAEAGLWDWTRDMYARHRGESLALRRRSE